ncbi:uncharacterized protein LOC126915293 isoform X2 [Bombus affinis]|uniref:uncharacterized protein LOC126915293 isoform X2 n=1 Tax=Bombus affinis TaxID=309941 RepID=UPI0021B72E36|nr:uncharacterized protein LOC126915293 isoform X2 [Bombus affinis]
MLYFLPGISRKKLPSTVIQFANSEEDRKQSNQDFIFRDIFLEEAEITPTRKIKTETEKPSLDMERLLETLQKRNKSKIEDMNFSIKQFGGTHKATDWISEYEEECRKYEIKSDEEKVKGSFIEYALGKERLILEIKRKIPEDERIHAVVIGLSIEIQDKIERESVQSTNDLIRILGQYEDQRKRKETQGRKINLDKKANPPFKKQPCTICEALNFLGRFHPVGLCRNRNRNAQEKPKQINSLQLFTSENEKAGTPDENKKN